MNGSGQTSRGSSPRRQGATEIEANGTTAGHLDRPGGSRLAYRLTPGRGPGVVFLGGFHADMTGSKATAVEQLARRRGHAAVRFDYFGHGASSGDFAEGRIGRWRDDALAVVDALVEGPLVLVGSSMGAWIALLVAAARPERVAALVGLASAPDFTEEVIWARCSSEERDTLRREGILWRRSPYEEQPWPLTLGLVEEARSHLVLGGPIPVHAPVRLVHSLEDTEVPWDLSRRLAERVESDDVELTLVKRGDHRLSDPTNLARLEAMVGALLDRRA